MEGVYTSCQRPERTNVNGIMKLIFKEYTDSKNTEKMLRKNQDSWFGRWFYWKTEVSSMTLGPIWTPNQTLSIEENNGHNILDAPEISTPAYPPFQGGTRELSILCDIP